MLIPGLSRSRCDLIVWSAKTLTVIVNSNDTISEKFIFNLPPSSRPTTTRLCACCTWDIWRSPWASWRVWCSRTPRSTSTRASSSTWPPCTSWSRPAAPRRSRLCWRPWPVERATASTHSASNWSKEAGGGTGGGHTPTHYCCCTPPRIESTYRLLRNSPHPQIEVACLIRAEANVWSVAVLKGFVL